ncbi:hypothetical protein WJX82_002514 [Trebouxia sp. C0006]
MSEKAPELPRARAGRTTEVGQPAVDKIPDATCRPVAASPTGVAYLAIEALQIACPSAVSPAVQPPAPVGSWWLPQLHKR